MISAALPQINGEGPLTGARFAGDPEAVRERILHVVPYFYPAWAYGGIPRLVYGLARQQVRSGARVTVVTTDAGDATRRAGGRGWVADLHGIRVARFGNLSNHLAYQHQLFLPLGAGRFLRRHATDHDVVHLHGHRHLLNNLAVRAVRGADVPVVLTPNGTLPPLERKLAVKRAWDLLLGDPVLRRCDALIAVSRAEVRQFRRAGIGGDRIHHVPNGIELAEFERPPLRGALRARLGIGDSPMILYLGKITPRKGVQHLIDALGRLQPADAQLVIAGNDMSGALGQLRRRSERRGVADRVHFAGLLLGRDRLRALVDADVLVYPSHSEIFGLVPFEGLLSGTPVVVGDDCGCGELVAHARAGFLAPFGDTGTLARYVEILLTDRAAGAAMVQRGRDYIRQHFTWPEVARGTADAYTAAIRRRARL